MSTIRAGKISFNVTTMSFDAEELANRCHDCYEHTEDCPFKDEEMVDFDVDSCDVRLPYCPLCNRKTCYDVTPEDWKKIFPED